MNESSIDNRKSTIGNRRTGTREWSEHSVNCCLGCSHGCLYCYARYAALHPRWGKPQIGSGADWGIERPFPQAARPPRRSPYPGVVMFPTTHDITPGNLDACQNTLARLLEAGNQVLVVSKARRDGLGPLLPLLAGHKGQVEVRISIGALDERLRAFWEPGAPPFAERVAILKQFHAAGVPTSVSCEPLLDPPAARQLVEWVQPYVSGTIWIGMANKLRFRTAWMFDPDLMTGESLLQDLRREIERLEAWQTPEKVRQVYESVKDNPKIRWKDSYRVALAKQGIKVEQGTWRYNKPVSPCYSTREAAAKEAKKCE